MRLPHPPSPAKPILHVAACLAATLLPGGAATGAAPLSLRETMLDAHNAARAAVGVGPLRWDDALAADAQAYADEMARTGRFAHAVQPLGNPHEGENLWAGTPARYSYGEMAGAWSDEARDFVDAPTPAFSRTGRWQDVGHYTQMVWRGTQTVGCAVATGADFEYLVCRYRTPGNVVGWKAY